jgi:hypothetical protein
MARLGMVRLGPGRPVPFRDLMTRKGTSSKGPAARKRRGVKALAGLPSVGRTRAGVRLAAGRAVAKASYLSPRGT